MQHFHYIKHLNIEAVDVEGNEKLLKIPNYADRIFNIMPSLKLIDRKCQTTKNPISQLPTVVIQNTPAKPSFPIDLGAGNDPIGPMSTTSIPISYQSNRKEEFRHLRDSFNSYRDEGTWTKVIIKATDLQKADVMSILLSQVITECVFFPCYYKVTPQHHEFFIYRNFDALKCMMQRNLEFPVGVKRRVSIELILKYAVYAPGQVNWTHKIRHVLEHKIEGATLNLSNFINDPNFTKLTLLLDSDTNMNFILEQVKKACPNLTAIVAQNSSLKSVRGFKNLNQQFPSLLKLDFSSNQILALDDLPAPITRVKEIILDNNPICSKYPAANEYVEHVRKHFVDVEILDGSKIDPLTRIPNMQNFIVSNKAYNLVDEFVKTYFGIYDSERSRLKELYTPNSIFSISVHYDPSLVENKSHISSIFTRIQAYLNHSRFLQKIANMNQVYHNIFVGHDAICNVLSYLPRTTHSLASFNVDVPFYNPESITVIKISGLFEDFGKTLNDKSNFYIGFSRNFVLKLTDNQVHILNDQLFIHNTKLTEFTSNMISQPEHEMSIDETESKQVKLILFKEITNLKQEEALKLLEKSFYNFKMALGIFKTLMENNSYQDNAFDFEN